jgi:hypothetical protein
MRTFARVAFILFVAGTALFLSAPDIIDPWQPYGNYGFTTDTAGVVSSVTAYTAGQGLQVGDRIDASRMNIGQRVFLTFNSSALPGRTLDVPLVSGKIVHLAAKPRLRSLADNVTDILSVSVLVAYTLLAAALVLVRPIAATWAFFLFSAAFFYNGTQIFQFIPTPLYVFFIVIPLVFQALSPIAFFSFAARFPNSQPQAGAKLAERILCVVAAPALTAWFVFSECGILLAVPVPNWQTTIALATIALLYLPGIAILFSRYAHSTDEERTRLRWIVAALTVSFVPYVITTAMLQYTGSYSLSLAVYNLSQAWLIIAPVALAYTVLKHRLFDIRFVVSRALVFGVLTTLTVGVLALADWGLGKWLEQSRFALVAEVMLAVLIGFSLTTVHSRIERFLNGVIFRAQSIALSAVRRFSHEVDLIAEPAEVIARTYETLRERIECDYVAIYTLESSTFVRSAPAGNELPLLFMATDLAVLRLRRWNEAFECDVPEHPLRGALLLPMTARTQLVGFIACGPKPDRTHYLPDEVAALEALAHRAGAGYAWLTLRDLTPLENASV